VVSRFNGRYCAKADTGKIDSGRDRSHIFIKAATQCGSAALEKSTSLPVVQPQKHQATLAM
jgi:hypothetical protein